MEELTELAEECGLKVDCEFKRTYYKYDWTIRVWSVPQLETVVLARGASLGDAVAMSLPAVRLWAENRERTND